MKEQRSLRGKVWQPPSATDQVKSALEADRRGETDARIWSNPAFDDLTDPLLMKGIVVARDRIRAAIDQEERIMVYGDFDADGITATASLVHGLKQLGAQVSYRIPDRTVDSHGVKQHLIDEILTTGTKLLITVDCGVNDRAEVAYAVEKGLEVIITDHHQVSSEKLVDQAVAVCNPVQPGCAYPHKNLSGVGVVFKLLQSLNSDQAWLQPYLALAAVGTVADCVKLTGESRTIVQLGLKALGQNHWPGITALLDYPDTITEETIGFQLAPRLNAASRLGEVQHAVQLFLGDANGQSERVAYLQQINQQRQELTKHHTVQAQTLIQPNRAAQVLFLDGCPLGILGLVASKLVEQLHQSTLCIAQHPSGGLHGSARGLPGADLSGLLQAGAEYLQEFGGHDGAAGFRLEEAQLADFMAHVQQWYASHPVPVPSLEITAEVRPSDLDLNWLEWQQTLGPFGQGNPLPVWQVSNLKLLDIQPMGREQNHARLTLKEGQEAVAFFATDLLETLRPGEPYDFAITLHENRWNGEVKCQWQVVDVRT